MMDSGLLVLLPLVGAVLGAFVGAWANSWYREREAKKAQDRELGALIVLVDVEIWSNDDRLEACIDQGSFDAATVAGLRIEDWKATKVRLSELLTDITHFDTLATYYEMVRKIQIATRTYSNAMQDRNFFNAMSNTVRNVRSLGSLARQDNRKYLPEDRYSMFAIPEREDPVKDWRQLFGR